MVAGLGRIVFSSFLVLSGAAAETDESVSLLQMASARVAKQDDSSYLSCKVAKMNLHQKQVALNAKSAEFKQAKKSGSTSEIQLAAAKRKVAKKEKKRAERKMNKVCNAPEPESELLQTEESAEDSSYLSCKVAKMTFHQKVVALKAKSAEFKQAKKGGDTAAIQLAAMKRKTAKKEKKRAERKMKSVCNAPEPESELLQTEESAEDSSYLSCKVAKMTFHQKVVALKAKSAEFKQAKKGGDTAAIQLAAMKRKTAKKEKKRAERKMKSVCNAPEPESELLQTEESTEDSGYLSCKVAKMTLHEKMVALKAKSAEFKQAKKGGDTAAIQLAAMKRKTAKKEKKRAERKMKSVCNAPEPESELLQTEESAGETGYLSCKVAKMTLHQKMVALKAKSAEFKQAKKGGDTAAIQLAAMKRKTAKKEKKRAERKMKSVCNAPEPESELLQTGEAVATQA